MKLPGNFICAGEEMCDYEHFVAAPYFRRSFMLENVPSSAKLVICGLGFYELYVNGKNITKGPLAPYISNPDDVLCYDEYDLSAELFPGENVIGVLLGGGMMNAFSGESWLFQEAAFRGSPRFAMRMILQEAGEERMIESDAAFKTAPSPIYFNDLRCGEFYDARREQPGWCAPGFDDSSWEAAKSTWSPRGEKMLCSAEPIVICQEVQPVAIEKQEAGYLFDFGVNTAGICRLSVCGQEGQKITLQHGELLRDGKLTMDNIELVRKGWNQKDIYICREGQQTHVPSFTYHGFRYVFAEGMTEEQMKQAPLTLLEMHSDLKERGGFSCSDKMANTLQKITRRSTLSNFFYFPTDCPHREKNGWTGDAALSAEHTLLNLEPEKSYRQWLTCVRKAQDECGALPGIVPTGGWGFEWGNGPAWDCVLTYLPYFTYLYRGDEAIVRENATAIFRYLHYLNSQIGEDGLIKIGLGDWCPVGRGFDDYKSPLEFTDTVISMDIAAKAAFLFEQVGLAAERDYALSLQRRLRKAGRERLIHFSTMTALGACQTSQAMAIYYDLFEPAEKPQAFMVLKKMIEANDGFMDVGILGARVLFHVLSDFGEADLAYHMITRQEYPSYGNWVARGATSLFEEFQPEGARVASMNHHFFGDISGWFISDIAGIHLNPHRTDCKELVVRPNFIQALEHAEGFHIAPIGRIDVRWKRQGKAVELSVEVPEGMRGKIEISSGWLLSSGKATEELKSGVYIVFPETAQLEQDRISSNPKEVHF